MRGSSRGRETGQALSPTWARLEATRPQAIRPEGTNRKQPDRKLAGRKQADRRRVGPQRGAVVQPSFPTTVRAWVACPVPCRPPGGGGAVRGGHVPRPGLLLYQLTLRRCSLGRRSHPCARGSCLMLYVVLLY